MNLPITYNNVQISQLPVSDDMLRSWDLMGSKEIRATIDVPGVLLCPVGASIQFRGEKYTINTIPSPTKKSSNLFTYDLVFESELYRLYDKRLRHLNNRSFQYYGKPADFAELIVNNINEISSGWTVGACDDAPEKTINFESLSCRAALDTIAEAFKFEWDVTNKVISFVQQVGHDTTLVFKYGQGNGLYSLGYEYQEDKNIVTRAYGYGSRRNLPENYRGGATQLMFDGLIVEQNTNIYGTKENDYENEDIYPKVTGTVTAVSPYNADIGVFKISDSGLSFNINDHLAPLDAKLSFLTGELQGQEFTITDYDEATKTITLKVFVDGSNNRLPNSTFQAHIGDTYTLFDMFMPDAVVEAAEQLLKQKTEEYLAENSIPRVLYNLELDPIYVRDNNIWLKPGDKVTVIDADLGINTKVRVTNTKYPVHFPDVLINDKTKISVQIANFIPTSITERVVADTIDNQKSIKIVDRSNAERARLNALNLKTLQGRIFNPDGSLFTGPDSIVAGMASFGFDSQNFNLNNVTITPNAVGNPNAFEISAGQLIHRVYKIDGLGYEWDIVSGSWPSLNPLKFYYVYAKCSKTSLSGTWEISETPVNTNDIAGYWAFNVGVLYEVNADGYRNFEFTKGMTYIVGDQITTGKIKSIDGLTYFDLNNGEIGGKIVFAAGSSGYNNLIDRPDLSVYAAQDFVDAALSNLQSQIDGEITSWFYDYAPTLANAPANGWADDTTKDKHLGDLFYNNLTGYGYRFAKTGSVYEWIRISDSDITLALANAAAAQDTADHKRRVFIVEPITPYDTGDLWAQGSAGDLKRCIASRSSGAFNAADWTLASKYTDDTAANAAQAAADAAQDRADLAKDLADDAKEAADDAQADASIAINKLADIANDNLLTVSEKPNVLKEWQIIQGEKPVINAQAANYSIAHIAFDDAFNSLSTYLTPLLSDMNSDSTITGIEFRSKFKDYYDAKVALLKEISDKAKLLADDAQSSANQAQADADEAKSRADEAYAAAAAAQNAADQAQIDADAANQKLTDIANDDLLTTSEKPGVLKEWQIIQGEKSVIDGQADTYSINHDLYDGAYDDLEAYVSPLLINMSVNTVIDGDEFRAKFKDYYDEKILLLKAISDKAKDLADDAFANAENARETADRAAGITDYLFTTITGNVVATGTLLVGDADHNNAGITGVTDNDEDSVRFWAGANYAGRYSAPFRVLNNGEMYATAGFIGGFNITNAGLENNSSSDAYIRQVKRDGSNNIIAEAYLGTSSVPPLFDGDKCIGYFSNTETGTSRNVALYLKASGASVANYALAIDGDIFANGNKGKTGAFDYRLGNNVYRAYFVCGLFTQSVYLGPDS